MHRVQLYYLYIYVHTILSPIIFFFMCYLYSFSRSRKTLYLSNTYLIMTTAFLWVRVPTAINFISELIILSYTFNFSNFILIFLYFLFNMFVLIKLVFVLQSGTPFIFSNNIIYLVILLTSVLLLDIY